MVSTDDRTQQHDSGTGSFPAGSSLLNRTILAKVHKIKIKHQRTKAGTQMKGQDNLAQRKRNTDAKEENTGTNEGEADNHSGRKHKDRK